VKLEQGELEELGTLLVERAFQYSNGTGPFILSSGETSKYYYDGKATSLLPSTLQRIGNALVDVILASGAEAVGGLELGSVPISTSVGLAALSRGRDLPTFVVRKARKGHGTRDLIAQAYCPDGELLKPGRRVAIVDDVVTKGGSVRQAIDVVKDLGCQVVLVAVLVERHEGGGDALRSLGYNVLSLFRTDEEGTLSVTPEYLKRLRAARAAATTQ
jgi:orotate phosphoribosyltransferase